MRRSILISQGGIPQVERRWIRSARVAGSKQQQRQACAAPSLSLARGAEQCPSTWPGVQTRILIIIYGKAAQRHALKGDGERDAASRAGRWLEEDAMQRGRRGGQVKERY